MPQTYADKIAEIEVELATLDHELAHLPEDKRGAVKARRASLQRSLRWYQRRSPRVITTLGASVGDFITTHEGR